MSTLISEEEIPQKYPCVMSEIKNTPSTNTVGINVRISKVSWINQFSVNAATSTSIENRQSHKYRLSFKTLYRPYAFAYILAKD